MQDLRKLWQHLARSKSVESYHVVQYAILHSLYETNGNIENATNLALKKLNTAFSPIKNKNKLDNGQKPLSALKLAIARAHGLRDVLGGPPELLSGKDLTNYRKVIYTLSNETAVKEYFDRKYVYIFVRQDISPEYQLVQSSHIALKLGWMMGFDRSLESDPNSLYFAVIGVPDLDGLKFVQEHLKSLEITQHSFIEPDIGNEMTGVATYPIPVNQRKPFQNYKRLRFRENT